MSDGKRSLSSKVVQTVVSEDVHKALRDAAYERGIPLKDLQKEILGNFAAKYLAEKG